MLKQVTALHCGHFLGRRNKDFFTSPTHCSQWNKPRDYFLKQLRMITAFQYVLSVNLKDWSKCWYFFSLFEHQWYLWGAGERAWLTWKMLPGQPSHCCCSKNSYGCLRKKGSHFPHRKTCLSKIYIEFLKHCKKKMLPGKKKEAI